MGATNVRMNICPRWRLGMWTSEISPRATSDEDLENGFHGHAANRASRLFAAASQAQGNVAARSEHASGRVRLEADRALVSRRGLGIRSIGARGRRRGRRSQARCSRTRRSRRTPRRRRSRNGSRRPARRWAPTRRTWPKAWARVAQLALREPFLLENKQDVNLIVSVEFRIRLGCFLLLPCARYQHRRYHWQIYVL